MAWMARRLPILAVFATGFGLEVVIDPSTAERTYDGHGALSAGANSRLLLDYSEPQRSELLDLLFKPGYGASLHQLKVEIGGDTWSTDGSEPSHMTHRGEVKADRGWEWWLLAEAKKRNPDIVTHALPWGAPGWVGDGEFYSRDTVVNYTLPWLDVARDHYNVTVDYLGIWNEKHIDRPDYVKELRAALDENGYQHVSLVVSDNAEGKDTTDIEEAMEKDPELNASVDVIGLHYPRGNPEPLALKLGKRLWASESLTTSANWAGTSLWARTLNQNFVRMNATAAIAWSLVWSVYPSLICNDHGLMDAQEPWSGYYRISQQVWSTAHTTMFTQPGWKYTAAGSGSGLFSEGAGSYVTLVDAAQDPKQLTVIVEFMDEGGDADEVDLTFALPALPGTSKVHLWVTNRTVSLLPLKTIEYSGQPVELTVSRWHLYTLSTVLVDATKIAGGALLRDGSDAAPSTAPISLPHLETFDDAPLEAPGRYFNDQEGTFVIVKDADGGQILQQQSTDDPIRWGNEGGQPCTIIGNYYQNYKASVKARIPASAVAAARSTKGTYVALCGRLGQPTASFGFSLTSAVCLTAHAEGSWSLSCNGSILSSGRLPSNESGLWLRLGLAFSADVVVASIDDQDHSVPLSLGFPDSGLVALASGRHVADFDDFQLAALDKHPVQSAPALSHSVYLGGNARRDFDGEVGIAISVSSPITVTALGRYRCLGDKQNHTLSLVRASDGEILATAQVDLSSASLDAAGFAFASIAPLSLSPEVDDHYYLVSSESQGGDCFYGDYEDACGGTSGGLPMYFSSARAIRLMGGVYRAKDGSWTEREDEQWLQETRRGYGAVNMLLESSGLEAGAMVVTV